ncbi:MAG: type II pantothenate kinase [Bacteroides sp.]|jgi:type II pantothenate kinase|nr:type II pantothenate kinase [Bacteroides sp.]
MILGIDIGGSTTKIVGVKDGKIIEPLTVEAKDPIASASGALGKFLSVNKLSLGTIEKVIITGVGASFITDDLLGLPVEKIEEFKALGYGGLFLSGLKKAIIVSMGTGTAFVKANQSCIQHLGGTGVGGGTILGLSKAMVNLSSFDTILETARTGRPDPVDLSVGDISRTEVGNLPSTITASNFGKMTDQATKNDITRGILTMVFQVIGMLAIFAARAEKDQDIVLSGKLVNIFQAQKTFSELGRIYNVKFHVPDHAEYCTAIGAGISANLDNFILGK